MDTLTASGWIFGALAVGVVLGSSLPRKNAERPPRKVSNIVLAMLGIFVLLFIVAMVITFWRFQTVPDTLIQCTLGAGGIEALALAGIKVTKVCKENRKGVETDE